MKIKEMKQKTVEFVKENKAGLAVFGGVAAYGIGMYIWGHADGTKVGKTWAIRRFKEEISLGKWASDMVPSGTHFLADRYSNETTFGGAMNNMKEAVKLLSDPKNTENVYGIMVLSKKND